MKDVLRRLLGILEVPNQGPEDARRRRLLNIMLVAVAVGSLLTQLALLITTPLGMAGNQGEIVALEISIALALLGAGLIYALNRFVSGEMASAIFVVLIIAIAATSDEPRQVVDGRSLLPFTIPILAASVLLRPWASLVAAGLSSIAIIVVGLHVPGHFPNIPAILSFFLLALVAWLSAQSLQNALDKQRASSSQLQDSKEQYRGLVEDTPILICRFLPDGEITFANKVFCDYFAKVAEELVGLSFFSLVPEADREAVVTTISMLTADSPTQSQEHQLIASGGDVRWMRWIFRVLPDAQGQVVAYQAIGEDITARKKNEHDVITRNRELALLNRVIAASASSRDVERIMETACRELATAFEVPVAMAAILDESETAVEIVAEYMPHGQGSRLGEVIPIASASALEQLVARKSPLMVHASPTDTNQDHIPHQPCDPGSGSMLLLPLIIQDEFVGVLELKTTEPHNFSSAEEGLAWSVADQVSGALALARLDEERRQLQEQYHQAQKMEAVGQLTAGVAHDFNNLLTAMGGYAELLQLRAAPDQTVYQMAGKILDSSQRAANLVRQLMTFSHKQIIESQVLDLNQVVMGIDSMLRRTIGEHIQLRMIEAPKLWQVKMDPTQAEQIIVNLAVNARDAMPAGGCLTIETANVILDESCAAEHLDAQMGEYVRLTVRDTGTGISPEVHDRIFEPFFTTKELGRGTGLGLANVFGIVKESGGHIQVESEEGVGTTFVIYLPRIEKTDTVPPPDLPEGRPVGGAETILLVEDEKSVRDLVRQVLHNHGYALLEAQNGTAALQLAAEYPEPIHLLLTDMVMPGMSGTALAREITERTPSIKVIVMSGYSEDIISRHDAPMPGVVLLQKPFTAQDLVRKLRATLDT